VRKAEGVAERGFNGKTRMKCLMSFGQVTANIGFTCSVTFPPIFERMLSILSLFNMDLLPALGLACRKSLLLAPFEQHFRWVVTIKLMSRSPHSLHVHYEISMLLCFCWPIRLSWLRLHEQDVGRYAISSQYTYSAWLSLRRYLYSLQDDRQARPTRRNSHLHLSFFHVPHSRPVQFDGL